MRQSFLHIELQGYRKIKSNCITLPMRPDKEENSFLVRSDDLGEMNWVERIRNHGDRKAFDQLFRAYYKKMFGVAYQYIHDTEQAEDIVQNIFLKIWLHRSEWNPEESLKFYLLGAVRNEALNVIRNQKTRKRKEVESVHYYNYEKAEAGPEDNGSDGLKKTIEKEIDNLPDRCREIFRLNRNAGLTYEEIAHHLDISINTVATQVSRALKLLREALSDKLVAYFLSIITQIFISG